MKRLEQYLHGLLKVVAAVTIAALVGCSGQDGPERADLYGTVTYKGEPVPVAEIRFTPDRSKGGSGPQALLIVRDGEYDTEGKEPVLGPQKVEVFGYDGKPTDMLPSGESLFPAYEIDMEIKPGRSELNFEIPARRR